MRQLATSRCLLFDPHKFHNRKLFWNALHKFRPGRREVLSLEVSLDGSLIRLAFNRRTNLLSLELCFVLYFD